MCLGIPSKIIRIEDSRATIDVYGAQRDISLMLLEDDKVKLGDYVLVHAGFAIQKLQEDDAKETLKLFDLYLEGLPEINPEVQQHAPEKKPARKQRKKTVKAAH